MKPGTLTIIKTVLEADSEVSPLQATLILKATAQTGPMPRRRLGTKREAAAILGVCPDSVKRYGYRGLLTQVKLSPHIVRYDLDQCEILANEGAAALLAKRSA